MSCIQKTNKTCQNMCSKKIEPPPKKRVLPNQRDWRNPTTNQAQIFFFLRRVKEHPGGWSSHGRFQLLWESKPSGEETIPKAKGTGDPNPPCSGENCGWFVVCWNRWRVWVGESLTSNSEELTTQNPEKWKERILRCWRKKTKSYRKDCGSFLFDTFFCRLELRFHLTDWKNNMFFCCFINKLN